MNEHRHGGVLGQTQSTHADNFILYCDDCGIVEFVFFAYSVVVVKIVADVCGAHPAVSIRVCVCMRVHGLFDRTCNN